MIKVLFVISNLNPQGPINQLFYLCKYLDKTIIEPIIVTTSQKSFENSMHNEFSEIGIRIIDLKLNKIQSILKATKKIQSLIDSDKIDIIQSFGFRSDIISYNLKNVYKITTIRNTILYNYKMAYGSIIGYVIGNIYIHFLRKFDKIISCSLSIKNYIEKLKLEPIVITNSIDDKILNEDFDKKIDKETYQRKLQLNKNKLNFITVSSKYKGKNIEFLTEAFSKDELLNYNLIIAGFTPPKIIEKFQYSENINFIGNVNNLNEYFKGIDFFISASLHEGMPNAVLEALAHGTPVLLSNIPSHEEILNKTEYNIGSIFKNNDFNDLKNQIKFVTESSYNLLSNNCKLAIIKFSSTLMAKQYEEMFMHLKSTITNKS